MHLPVLRLALLAILVPFVRAAETAASPAAEKLFAITFSVGPSWDQTKAFNEQTFFKEHSANLNRMRAENVLVLGGRYAENGLIIVRAADETAAKAQLAKDPSLAAGTFQAKIDEYRPFFHGTTQPSAAPAKETPAAKPKHFTYVLRLVPRLHDDNAWSDADKASVSRHFAHLSAATKAGQVILAGRTMEPGDKTFGLVIFEATDETAARSFMNSDPAVADKIMTAELHPYMVALQRK
jgi:uncharacterized protein